MRKLIALLSPTIVAVLLSAMPAHAVVAVGAPGGDVTGQYGTPVIVADPAAPLEFVNLDIAPHNIEADATGPNTNGWCHSYPSGKCPLFHSDVVAATSALAGHPPVAQVQGIDKLTRGQTYTFHCIVHPFMHGTLVVG